MTSSTMTSKSTQTLPVVVKNEATKDGCGKSLKKPKKNVIKKKVTKSNNSNKKVGFLSTKVADACLDWVIFPALLFIQFGATMHWSSTEQHTGTEQQLPNGIVIVVNDDCESSLNWMVVHSTIFLFCLIAGIYRQILRQKSDSIVFLLLPEVFTNILLALVMILPTITFAYYVLVVLSVVLATIGCIFEYFVDVEQRQEVVTSDYQRLNDEDDDEDGDDCVVDEWVC